MVGEYLCDSKFVLVQTTYPPSIATQNFSIYSVNGVSTDVAAALKFSYSDGFALYVNDNFSPKTIGELLDGLGLSGNIKINNAELGEYENGNSSMIGYSLNSDKQVVDILLSNRNNPIVSIDAFNFNSKEAELTGSDQFNGNANIGIDSNGCVYYNGFYFMISQESVTALISAVRQDGTVGFRRDFEGYVSYGDMHTSLHAMISQGYNPE